MTCASDAVRLVMTDVLGREVRSEEIRSSLFERQRGGLMSGLYPYRIISGDHVLSCGSIALR